MTIPINDLTSAWITTMNDIFHWGDEVAPRGKLTLELPQYTSVIDMRKPVVTSPERSLSYRFMAAEAYWILTGDNRVATIAPYNSRIAEFSDDGETFFGAYGPKIMEQLPGVVARLQQDPNTRQAGLTIWRENPPATKDVPCTVALWFQLRRGKLNCHSFMRSNDVWLGLPYDAFNFSMLAHLVCAELNSYNEDTVVEPGVLFHTAASSHLYDINWADAKTCIQAVGTVPEQNPTPAELYINQVQLMTTLKDLRESRKGDPIRWWELQA